MALLNTSGNYHKIETVDLINNTVHITKWENEAHRQNGDTDFKTHLSLTEHLPNLYEALKASAEDISILNNIKTVAYQELKKQAPYSEMGDDVIPTIPVVEEETNEE